VADQARLVLTVMPSARRGAIGAIPRFRPPPQMSEARRQECKVEQRALEQAHEQKRHRDNEARAARLDIRNGRREWKAKQQAFIREWQICIRDFFKAYTSIYILLV
jgi:hypothetical protein